MRHGNGRHVAIYEGQQVGAETTEEQNSLTKQKGILYVLGSMACSVLLRAGQVSSSCWYELCWWWEIIFSHLLLTLVRSYSYKLKLVRPGEELNYKLFLSMYMFLIHYKSDFHCFKLCWEIVYSVKNEGNINFSSNWCVVMYAAHHLKCTTYIRTQCPCRMLSCILQCCLFEVSVSFINSCITLEKS